MSERRRFKQATSFLDRLSAFAASVRAKADTMADGEARDEMLRKVQRAETAAEIHGWANSRELQPPK